MNNAAFSADPTPRHRHTSRRPQHRPLALALAVACSMAAATSAQAADRYWKGGTGPNWSTAANWIPVGASSAPGAGDFLHFDTTTAALLTANLANSFAGIAFGANAGAFTMTGTASISLLGGGLSKLRGRRMPLTGTSGVGTDLALDPAG